MQRRYIHVYRAGAKLFSWSQPAIIPSVLPAREAEALYWIAQGKSNPNLFMILTTSVCMIHKHVENIFRKLGL